MSFITFTGADDSISPETLLDVAASSSIGVRNVEWGILYSLSNQGAGRFPSLRWIDALVHQITPDGPSFALHVCGQAVYDLLAGRGHISELAGSFNRVQINFRAENHAIEDVRACLLRNPGTTFITQYNDANRGLWESLAGIPNHAVLFDASGGRGRSPDTWRHPLPGVPCGYAGGLGPDNLATELPRIHAAAGGSRFWIDMEGKLRDEGDKFSLVSARRCLDIAGEFLRHP